MIKKLPAGEKLIPELQLAKKLKVSHATVRRAIQDFVDEGLIYRQRGIGTFIREKNINLLSTGNLSLRRFFCGMENATKNFVADAQTARFTIQESASYLEIYRRVVHEYRKKHSDFQIWLDNRPSAIYIPEYFAEIEKGVSPDIFYAQKPHLYWLIQNHYIAPLNEYLEKEPVYPLNELDLLIRNGMTYNDKIWMLPKNMHVYTLVFNRNKFDAAGIKYPDESWTWQSFLEAAKELTIKNKKGEVIQYGSIPFRSYVYLAMLIWAFGGCFVNENGKICLTMPETEAAIKFAVDLTVVHKVTPAFEDWKFWSSKGKISEISNFFKLGKLAMHLPGVSYFDNPMTNMKTGWDMTLLPQGKSGRFSPVFFSGWCLSSTARHPARCAEFMKYLSVQGGKYFAEHDMPALNNSENLHAFYNDSLPRRGFVYMAMKNYMREFPFKGHFWPYLSIYIRKMLEDIFEGRKSFKTALHDTQNNMQKAMNQFLKWQEGKM